MRRVEGITQALWGSRVSPGTVSKLNQKIYTRIEEMESDYGEIYVTNNTLSEEVASQYDLIIRNVNRKYEDCVQELSSFIVAKVNEYAA